MPPASVLLAITAFGLVVSWLDARRRHPEDPRRQRVRMAGGLAVFVGLMAVAITAVWLIRIAPTWLDIIIVVAMVSAFRLAQRFDHFM